MDIDEDFKTRWDLESFTITTSAEGDCSYDGGYNFETVICTKNLDLESATTLRDELNSFIEKVI